jgi:chromatin remodeling complex protein RSC6
MVRATTPKSVKSAETAPVPVASSTENVVVEKSVKPRVKKAKTTEAVEPVEMVASPVPSEPVVASTEPSADIDTSIASMMTVFGAKLQQGSSHLATLKVEFKALVKLITRDLKNAQKSSSRRKKSSANRQPSGFVKPTRISDELAQFLGKTIGTEMARTEVSKEINRYIKSKGLQNPANGRKINPDVNLAKLLNITDGSELTYFNLQRYMKHHFIKPADQVVSVSADQVASVSA